MSTYEILLTVQYISIVLMLFMCAYIIKRWKKPLHGWLFFYCMVTLISNAGYLGLMQARDEEAAILLWQICYLGRVWVPFSLLQFVMILCEKRRNINLMNILALIHAATYFLVLGMRYNTLYYTSFHFVQDGTFPHLAHTNGIWHLLYDILLISYIVYGFYILFKQLRIQNNRRRRYQLISIFGAIFVDCFFYILEFLGMEPAYDVTNMGYTLASVFLYLAIFRYDMLGSRELARDFVVDRVAEGVIITDEDDEIIDYNQMAKNILPDIDDKPTEVMKDIHQLIEENRTLDVGERKFTPKENRLNDGRKAAGKVYMLSDDTQHYRHAEQLTREMMLALSKTVDAKDHYTNGHSSRVAAYSKEIARRMGKNSEEQEMIYEMGLLHDIGKIGVSEDIINKTGKLSDEEFAHIKEHTIIGYNILKQISAMPELSIGARNHHERYDGRGYPDGLKGKDIPEEARIICLADCYDAMTSTRTYSKPKTQEEVRAEIIRCKGSQFDPDIADIFISIIDDDRDYQMHE